MMINSEYINADTRNLQADIVASDEPVLPYAVVRVFVSVQRLDVGLSKHASY